MKTVFVVGNKFRDFARNEGVVTIGELAEMVRTSSFERLAPGSRLVAGQGVREADLQAIHDQARHALTAQGIDVQPILRRGVRASRLQTHKHRIENAIISHPVQVTEDCFEAALLLDERRELMTDHQTGQHIQGMILIEAARQMFLAVTEEYFIGQVVHDRYYFVIHCATVEFTGFVFPLAATLRYEVLSKETGNPARMRFETRVSVLQGGACATQVEFSFTAFHASKIEAKEQKQALALLQFERQARESEAPEPVEAASAATPPAVPQLATA
jgi:hypothetical protein